MSGPLALCVIHLVEGAVCGGEVRGDQCQFGHRVAGPDPFGPCGACDADAGEGCRPHCIAVDSILNGIEDATNALDEPPTS